MPEELIIGRDYTVDPDGRYVFTADYLRNRGTCCGSRCRNCPYRHENVPTSGVEDGEQSPTSTEPDLGD